MSEGAFERSLNQAFYAFEQALVACTETYGRAASYEARKAAAQKLFTAGQDLMRLLDQVDRPDWLNQLTDASRTFCLGQRVDEGQSENFLRAILAYSRTVAPIRLGVKKSHDFDALYARIRDEQRLPELFDRMIAAVSDMVASGEIESTTVLAALGKLLDLLKANRTGSYLATLKTITYAGYMRSLCKVAVARIPVVGIFWEAYEDALSQAEQNLETTETKLERESLALVIDEKLQARLERVAKSKPLITGPVDDAIEGELVDNQGEPPDAGED